MRCILFSFCGTSEPAYTRQPDYATIRQACGTACIYLKTTAFEAVYCPRTRVDARLLLKFYYNFAILYMHKMLDNGKSSDEIRTTVSKVD